MTPKDNVINLVKAGDVPRALSVGIEAGMSNIGQIVTDEIMKWDPIPELSNVRIEKRTTY